MIIDGYEITSILKITGKTFKLTYFMPSELDKGIEDQIKANGFGYVNDNIPVLD